MINFEEMAELVKLVKIDFRRCVVVPDQQTYVVADLPLLEVEVYKPIVEGEVLAWFDDNFD